MSHLSIRLLGKPDVRHGDREVTFATRKALALLVYLVVEGESHLREKITTLFWPDSGSAQGRATLRSTLAFLREALGDAADHLTADRDSISFELGSGVDLDLNTLQAAAQLTQRLPSGSANIRETLARLKGASDLLRGEFLEGFSLSDAPEFDNWTSLQREAWHRRAAAVLDWLSQLQSEGGELANAIETTARWAAHDPLNEAAHRRLMQLHFTAGNRSAALKAYDTCRAILERELNAEPAPETEALVERLRTQAPPITEPVGQESGMPHSEAPLIGRAAEHSELIAAYRAARRGQPRGVCLEGEPGIGKTRLAKEFLAWASAQGAAVLAGRAFEMGGQLPYQPVVDALRRMADRFAALSFSRIWLAELTRLLPELLDLYPDLPAPLALAESESRSRLFEAVARLGQALAGPAPLIVFVDDLQWADAASLDLLGYAARRWAAAQTPALLLFTARSEDLPAVHDWLTSLGRDVALTRVTLNPLTLDDTRALVESLEIGDWRLRSAPLELENAAQSAPSLISNLYSETGGHPLFIIETLKSLREHPTESGVPVGVREVIQKRLSRLSPNARAVCSAAAVLSGQFEFAPLCRVTALSEDDGLPALEELLARGLLREVRGREAGRLYFTHDKIREVAYADLSEARRQVFHRRALEALDASAAPGELARHALAAGLTERAFHLLVSAGDDALRVYAPHNALTFYEHARDLLVNYAAPAPKAQSLHLALGRAYELANEWAQARAAYQTLLTLARQAHQPAMESVALNSLALVAAKALFDIPAAADLLHEAQQAAERSGDKAVLAETEMNLSQMGLYQWDAAGMIAHAEQALALGRELNRPEIIARTLNMAAYAGVVSGRWNRIEARARESRELYAQLGNRPMEADSLALVGAIKTHSGHPHEGVEIGRAAYGMCLELENEWGQANCAFYLAHTLLELGEYSEALPIAHKGVAAARVAGHPPLLVFNLLALGNLYRAVFALDEARAAHTEALMLAQMLQHPYLMEWSAAWLCADEAAVGNWDAAQAHAQQALALRATDPTVKAFAALYVWHETEALMQAGHVERAAADVQRHGERVNSPLHTRYRIPHQRALAVLAQARGEAEAARAHLQQAAALAESIGLPGELWQLYAALGERHKAAALVQSLATRIDDEKLRSGFLAAEPVQQIIAGEHV